MTRHKPPCQRTSNSTEQTGRARRVAQRHAENPWRSREQSSWQWVPNQVHTLINMQLKETSGEYLKQPYLSMCLVRLAQIMQHVNRKERKCEKYKMIQVLTMIPIIFSKVPKKKKIYKDCYKHAVFVTQTITCLPDAALFIYDAHQATQPSWIPVSCFRVWT